MIRNAETLEWLSAAPIFDSGTSLGYNRLERSIADIKVCKPFKKTHNEQLQLVTSFDWIEFSKINGIALASDAFFPFGDNIERARRSGVSYICEPGGSIRDDQVIETCDKYGIAMAFTGMRLFHH